MLLESVSDTIYESDFVFNLETNKYLLDKFILNKNYDRITDQICIDYSPTFSSVLMKI